MAKQQKTFLMMRARGFIGPGVKRGKKAATPKNRIGFKPVGNYILYKVNNP
jgi:hypothetical protein